MPSVKTSSVGESCVGLNGIAQSCHTDLSSLLVGVLEGFLFGGRSYEEDKQWQYAIVRWEV